MVVQNCMFVDKKLKFIEFFRLFRVFYEVFVEMQYFLCYRDTFSSEKVARLTAKFILFHSNYYCKFACLCNTRQNNFL
jgi:hypothetical protein